MSKENVQSFPVIVMGDFQRQVGWVEIANSHVEDIESVEHLLLSPMWNRNGVIAFSCEDVPMRPESSASETVRIDRKLVTGLLNMLDAMGGSTQQTLRQQILDSIRVNENVVADSVEDDPDRWWTTQDFAFWNDGQYIVTEKRRRVIIEARNVSIIEEFKVRSVS